MQFKNPAFLYALFLILIPILIHLFQFRKFKRQYFTNVKFLKRLQEKSRKSSQIKKWLVLTTRILALVAMVLAFAQPYFPATQGKLKNEELVIYLDNSFSLQQSNQNGKLLPQAVQKLIQSVPLEKEFTLITNDKTFPKTTTSKIKNELIDLPYSEKKISLQNTYLKAKNHFSDAKNSTKTFLAISDFQSNQFSSNVIFDPEVNNQFLPLKGNENINISIDTTYITDKVGDNYKLHVQISASKKNNENYSVAIYDSIQLLAKNSVRFDENLSNEIVFNLNHPTIKNGKIALEDKSLDYDNELFFSINPIEKIKVAAIGANNQFLNKIFVNQEQFDFHAFTESNIDFNILEKSDLIVLNELKQIPNSLQTLIQQHLQQDKIAAFIPALEGDINNYNTFLVNTQAGDFSAISENELKIIDINFSHPLYQNVFERQISNFDYPQVKSVFTTNASRKVLSYANNQAFLYENNGLYVFTSSLTTENSNFTNSPLVVPTFYNMAILSSKFPKLYYEIGKKADIDINYSLNNDDVLALEKEDVKIIPLQSVKDNKVAVSTLETPEISGVYKVTHQENTITHLSYNYARNESDLQFYPIEDIENASVISDLENYFDENRKNSQDVELWKWFIIFALLFLMIEMLLLKFLK
ncbi:BatA domain-containing protein [Mesonia sp. K7]|uniref:BatA domain-containing protein n=1 Tax=Mesonia sp. K7 TaxID=2218606 RepID=UPI000DA84B11|nr:BatA domain-containing protein [Mesonia sp. K7]PZD78207.1 hypothetical protein DNG35_05765 [Mesonia sp. K7]